MATLKRDFEKFYNENVDKVYRFVFFRCQNKSLTEDLVSEIFLKVLEHFAQYDESKSKTAWLMTIAKNHLANYWRDRKITIPIEVENEDDEGGVISNDAMWLKSSLIAAEKQVNKNMLNDILSKLKPEEAEIVTLHYLFGYSYSEIASMRGTTEGAVKVAAHRVIKKMHALL